MTSLYQKSEKFVIDAYTKIGKPYQNKHFIRTVYWVKQLKPDADEALLIAAVAHDIERGFRQKDMHEIKKKGYTKKEFLQTHQERGAEIIGNFLKEQGADKEFINRVKMLVEKHEEGGNADQDLLKDADSISFFENNAERFIKVKIAEVGKSNVREKFDWMFNRISSKKAKDIARPWYENAIKELDSK